jgi:hypothetical protein
MELQVQYINSLEEYLSRMKLDTASWESGPLRLARPWFRGQDRTDSPIPRLFRAPRYDEFELTRAFRDRAGAFGNLPETKRLDKWLFLMQHYGAPTRLLDWTESPLIALFFAIDGHRRRTKQERLEGNPAVWVLNPLSLNQVSGIDGFPNTWARQDLEMQLPSGSLRINQNPGVEFFRLAFHPVAEWSSQINSDIVRLAIAVQPNYLDMRMYSQRSCFTIHGIEQPDIEGLYNVDKRSSKPYLLKYVVTNSQADAIYSDLQRLGISRGSVFPDFEGISQELSERFRL